MTYMTTAGNLLPRDKFSLWGEECKILVKVSRKGGANSSGWGGIIILLSGRKYRIPWDTVVEIDRETKKEKEPKEGKIVPLSKYINKWNPHINKGLYVTIILVISSVLGILALSIFMGH